MLMLWCYGGVIGFEEMTATGMTGEEVFKKIDKDGNGKVNRAELQVVLEEVGFTVTPSLLTNVMLRFTRYVEEKRGERDNTLCAVRAACCVLCACCVVLHAANSDVAFLLPLPNTRKQHIKTFKRPIKHL